MQLSVVILNYNVRFFLEQCLLSVQDALKGIDSEIIVVDNDSKDDSCQMVKQLFPDVILIENKENTGFPKGNNIGVARAKGKYLCILNPDTVVAEDTFSALLDFAQTKEKLGIVGCKLIDGTGNFLPESKRNVPTPKISLLKMLGKSNRYYANHLSENQIGKASVFAGAFMFVEKQKYLELHGFDEDFFMYGEDIDLSYRFEKSGYENHYFGETAIIHYKGESTNKDKVYLQRFYGAMKIFYKKHFTTNFLFDLLTDCGIKLFSVLGYFKNKPQEKLLPEYYIFVSKDKKFGQHLSEKLQQKIDLISDFNDYDFSQLYEKKVEVILDNSLITNRDIVGFMQEYKNQNFTFKIRPRNTHFIIGSAHKNGKGEITLI
ncbi:MAG TPA: glycosyltransferase family 2 protein [Flavobacterium sp.]|nr:glycosyltransferase family 2 protein [Flavobacterium sp.]